MNAQPVGVFDSGVGGVTVLKKLLQTLPLERFVYFGDTARVPYGNKSPETVRRYCREIANFLLRPEIHGRPKGEKIKMLVIACNTASAVAAAELSRTLPVPVLGVVKSGAQAAARACSSGRIAVIGTKATINSRVYEKHLRRERPSLKIISQACPLLVPLVEEGWFDHPVTRQTLKRYLNPILAQKPQALILGCTHYPMLEFPIRRLCGDTVAIIDSPSAAAQDTIRYLQKFNLASSGQVRGRRAIFYVSDDPLTFQKTARLFLGRSLPGPVKQIRLSS
ncbi:MAG: glutamate racemase [Elusimicrobia bacterium]|nr:glutamate racemase [Elusimicrobiota bacterium]